MSLPQSQDSAPSGFLGANLDTRVHPPSRRAPSYQAACKSLHLGSERPGSKSCVILHKLLHFSEPPISSTPNVG